MTPEATTPRRSPLHYTRVEAVSPGQVASHGLSPSVRTKYWPPVRRVDNAHGDRNLVCACPAPEAFEE